MILTTTPSVESRRIIVYNSIVFGDKKKTIVTYHMSYRS
jgi:uncharacterized protein YbjQ (UPF0145 family)